LLNSPYDKEEVWSHLPGHVQKAIIDQQLKCYVIDATAVARDTGMSGRINTIMQTCFFALSGVLPKEEAIAQIKQAIQKTYSKKGASVVDQNFKAVDATLAHLYEVTVPAKATSHFRDAIGSS
jgi:pyruvate-ferredoxin/flavodoxin oxidoreductase